MHRSCGNAFHNREWILFLVCVWCFVSISTEFPFDIPLVAEELPEINGDKPGCYMDREHYVFGEQWSPVFIPQGVMVCVRCQCLPIEKKGVVQARGRTMCRNIKDLCPVPTCANPTLRPGKCCKACKEDENFEDSFSFQPNVFVNDVFSQDAAAPEIEATDFQALLVGQHVPLGPVSTRAMALVHLSIEGSDVHYALRYNNLDRPKYLRILHINGNVLFQTPIIKEITGDKKACGQWTKPLPTYLDYIREGILLVVISTSRHPDGIVAGRIKMAPDKRNEEVFSSLMIDKTFDGGGALASISYNPKSKVAGYEITLDDVVEKGRRGIFTVSIMKGSKVIYKTKGTALAKTTKLSGKWKLYKRNYRKQLARGRLRLRVKFSNGHVLIGDIQTKLTCSIFQAVLSGRQASSKRKTHSAGSVVMQMGDNGKLHYSIRLTNMLEEVAKIRLEGYRRKKKGRTRAIGNMYPSFVRDNNQTFSGWANGTLKKLDAEAIHGFLNDQLHISVKASKRGGKELRGRLVDMRFHQHLGIQESPITLHPVTQDARGGAGHVWLSIDSQCRLHFGAVYAPPVGGSKTFEVYLGADGNGGGKKGITPKLSRLPLKGSTKKLAGYIYGQGDIVDLPDEVFRDLDRGRTYLKMSASENKEMYRANVTVSNSCWMYSDGSYRRLGEDNRLPGLQQRPDMCLFEGQVYQEGAAWIPDVDQACTTCSCIKGVTQCQRMTCPKLSCSNPVSVDGRCCPSCPHEDPSEMCQLGEDPRHYPLHSLWHPYLPTEGFSPCALCTCLPGKKVQCFKTPCPDPSCPKSDWVRDENNSCCYRCKKNSPLPFTQEVITQPQRDFNMEGACIINDDIHPNGETWHPKIHPFGYMKCFKCRCQDGNVTCGHVQCPVLRCIKRIKRRTKCCEECEADQSSQVPIDETETPKQGCRVDDAWYGEGQRWKPSLYNNTETDGCYVCKCKSGEIQCQARCPKICRKNLDKHPCCKHCSEDRLKIDKMDKSQLVKERTVSINVRKSRRKSRKNGKSPRKSRNEKGRNRNDKALKFNLISSLD